MVFLDLDAWFLRIVVSVVFRGLDSVFVWILDFLVSLRNDFSVGIGSWILDFGLVFLGLVVFQDNSVFLGMDRMVIGCVKKEAD